MKAFISSISSQLENINSALVEKDYYLHRILKYLTNYKFLKENLIFKGGTCLIKTYLRYYRFSEDLDFTWKNQEIFQNLSGSKKKSCISKKTDKIGAIVKEISDILGFDFIPDKGDSKYFNFSHRMVTLYVHYNSLILERTHYIKIEINFIDKILFPPKIKELSNIISAHSLNEEVLELTFQEDYINYSSEINFTVYDIREIICEKIRAIMTRTGIKQRDLIDLFYILKNYDVKIFKCESYILEKILFMTSRHNSYQNNFEKKKELLEMGELFTVGSEKSLMIEDIDETSYYKFIDAISVFLKKVFL